MGNSASNKGESPPAVELPRTHNLRLSMRTKLPMPDQNELERRFTKVLVSQLTIVYYGFQRIVDYEPLVAAGVNNETAV